MLLLPRVLISPWCMVLQYRKFGESCKKTAICPVVSMLRRVYNNYEVFMMAELEGPAFTRGVIARVLHSQTNTHVPSEMEYGRAVGSGQSSTVSRKFDTSRFCGGVHFLEI